MIENAGQEMRDIRRGLRAYPWAVLVIMAIGAASSYGAAQFESWIAVLLFGAAGFSLSRFVIVGISRRAADRHV